MRIMIIGAGKLGYKLAHLMDDEDIDVTLVDTSFKTLEGIGDHLDVLTVVANGIQIGALRELDIGSYDFLIASTDSDETNTLICTLAKKLKCEKTIARIRNPEFIEQLDFVRSQMGIDYIINPDLTTAKEIERYLLKSYNFYSDDFAKGKVSMVDFHIGGNDNFVNKAIKDLKGLKELIITAISRDGNLIIPNGSTRIMKDDTIHVMGRINDINKLAGMLNVNMDKKRTKRAMILGGGKIGFYLAQSLELDGVLVTIIEKDKSRCQYLSERLNHTMVIHGDGTDINILEEEDLASMDAFVGVTGFDEQNLLMSLVAKQLGVNKTIAKISRPNYVNIIDKLDVDIALNPVDITASDILRYVRGGKVISVSLLLGGQGEVTEITVTQGLPIVGKPLSQLGLPRGIIIGAVIHKGRVIIPKGDTVIHPKDKVIVFTLTSDVLFNKLLKPNRGGMLNELWHRG